MATDRGRGDFRVSLTDFKYVYKKNSSTSEKQINQQIVNYYFKGLCN